MAAMTAVADEELPVVSPPPRPHRRQRRRVVFAAVGAVLVVFVLFLGYSLIAAWRTPGNEDFIARYDGQVWLRPAEGT